MTTHDRYKLLPYGCYVNGTTRTFFDRRYRPIVAMDGNSVRRCDPAEWIPHDDKFWFYHDSTSPRHDTRTRIELQKMMASIPALSAEIERRAA